LHDADKSIVTFAPSGILPVIETPLRNPLPPFPSLLVGVGHPASCAAMLVVTWLEQFDPAFASLAIGVGQPQICAR
jgi:hypothetical protein